MESSRGLKLIHQNLYLCRAGAYPSMHCVRSRVLPRLSQSNMEPMYFNRNNSHHYSHIHRKLRSYVALLNSRFQPSCQNVMLAFLCSRETTNTLKSVRVI